MLRRMLPGVLVALVALTPASVRAQGRAYALDDVLELVRGSVPTQRILERVRANCGFRFDAAAEARLQEVGADAALTAGLRSACAARPDTQKPETKGSTPKQEPPPSARKGIVEIQGELPPQWYRIVNSLPANSNRTVELTPGRPAVIVVTAPGFCADTLPVTLLPAQEYRWTPVLRGRPMVGDC